MAIDKEKVLRALQHLRKMCPPFEGGCLCGRFRYRCSQTPIWSANCHCKACQKLSGAPFTSAFTVRSETFEVLSGEAVSFNRVAESGGAVSTVRCKNCGTWVYAERSGNPRLRSVLAPTLDDTSKFVPISNVYVGEATPWTVLDSGVLQFNGMPEDELN